MNHPRRPSRPFRSSRPTRGSGFRSGGRGGRPPEAPVFMGEPSPSLAKINGMNMAKLQAKILTLDEEINRTKAKLERLKAVDPVPTEKIGAVAALIERLEALRTAAADRLAGKAERKAERDRRYQ